MLRKKLYAVLFSRKSRNIIEEFNLLSCYLDNLLNIDNEYFEQMVYPKEFLLNKIITSDAEARFLDLILLISNDIFPAKLYDKRDNFDIVNYSFWMAKSLVL